MKKIFPLIIISSLFIFKSEAQYFANYNTPVQDINGVAMKYPWTGGLNNPQFSDGDFNNDGIKDLFIFDRTGNKIYTFINHGTANTVDYEYAPEYEAGFPKLHDWALLRDYNCDGICDIFSYTGGPVTDPGPGIQVYRGYYSLENKIQFVSVDSLLRYPILVQDSTFYPNLYVSSVDIPAIADVNGDGDLDVLTFQITGGYVMYFENLSEESGYGCDSLLFKKEDDCWGDFFETSFQKADLLNQPCPFFQSEQNDVRSPDRHTGSVETAWDNDGDGDVEFLKGDISFSNLDYLVNGGTNNDAHMISEDTAYPGYDTPADVFIFPAPFLVDVNNDGLVDLLVSPDAAGGSVNFTCSWYYKNVGNAITATFSFQSDTFMNGDMIDVGEGCYPVFFDADGDSLLDMIVGNRGYFDNTNVNIYIGELAYYKNIGDAEHPVFKLITKDYANVSSLGVKSVVPTFGDMDGDGDDDMILGQEDGSLLYFKNIAPAGEPADFIFFGANYAGIDVGNFAAPQLVDVNRDGLLDLLIGEQSGNLNYYENTGSATAPDFSSAPNNFFGSVDVRQTGYLTGYSVPFLFDDNDGNGYRLLVGSQRGTIYKYSNIDNHLSDLFTKDDTVFNGIREGIDATVNGADVNNDGKVDLLVGNFRGGATFYDSKVTGIDQQQQAFDDALQVYPNPAVENFTVKISPDGYAGEVQFSLRDLFGKKISEQRTQAGSIVKMDVNGLPSGIYLLQMNAGSGSVVKKIIITH
ncbi:MAG TPA: T9SS type A sorting domain-containing protein [Chitinophagales bacterium]|nr:T9SS type A sorting domain-containing protein [Chitinophagales bacterium]